MEILTLLKANILHKKGSFISVVLLIAIVVTAITAVFSVQDNYNNALKNAYAYADYGEITTYFETESLTDEICQSVENNALVERVEYLQGLVAACTTIGDVSESNPFMMLEMSDNIRLFNDAEDAFETDVPPLQKGEIYLPLGLKYRMQCDVGDTVHVELIEDQTAEFTVKGFVQEPSLGAMMIGIKYVFISHEDFENIYTQCKPLETEDMHIEYTRMQIYQAADSTLSISKFQRQLNQETKIVDLSWLVITKEQSFRYSKLLPDICLNIVLVFAALLFVTVLIVMSHSISTEIEIDYTSLGILKSQGFSKGKIRIIIMLQYLIAEIFGIIIGCIVSIPIENIISDVCKYVTAVLPENGVSIGKALLFTLVILLISVILILIKTRKISNISPVRAISGGREEIFFDSRLNMPIVKKCLSASLSLRQFTSAKKRYFGTMLITAILTFCMITINLTGNMLSSRNALKAMGITFPDIEVTLLDEERIGSLDDIDTIVASYTEIKEKNASINLYLSLNGENLHCGMYENPEYICVLKGREPLYDNEIVITEMVADALEVQMGDEVTVTSGENEENFIISGIYQSGSDAGMTFSMNFEGAQRLNIGTNTNYRYYCLADETLAETIADEIKETYGDAVSVEVYEMENNSEMQLYNMIVMILKVIIYTFSVLFAFIVVRMVCSKTFVQERTDIGIYKAIGFSSNRLRFGFAIRFLIIAVIGSVLSTILSVPLSERILSLLFGLIGLSRLSLEYTFISILVPFAVISLSYFVFAYLVSRKIKKVAIKELVVE